MIDNQYLAILHEVTYKKERSISKLTGKYALSKRQVTYALKKINDILSESREKPITVLGDEVVMHQESELYLQEYLLRIHRSDDAVLYSKESRKLMILLLFACSFDYLSLDHLLIMLKSSKSTVINDLKEIKQLLAEHEIRIDYSRLKGYQLTGKEESIRYFIMQMVINNLYKENGEQLIRHFIESQLQMNYGEIQAEILAESQKYHIHFFENKLKEFTYCFILLSERFRTKQLDQKYPNNFSDQYLGEYFFSASICDSFEISKPESIHYITAWVLGLSTGDFSQQTSDASMIKEIVRRIISRFENLAGIRFLDEEAVLKRLYEHFRPTYYRLLYHLPIINPLTEKIQSEYSDTYFLVNEAVKPLQALFSKELPSDEIALLTVHFAASTFEEQEEQIKKSRGLVLCPNGIGTSLILVKELETLFPNIDFVSQGFHEKITVDNFDIVFTTTITPEVIGISKPFIVVNPILSSEEKFELIGRVNSLLNEEPVIDPRVADILKVVKKFVTQDQFQSIKKEVLRIENTHSNVIIKEGSENPLLSEITGKDLIKLNVSASNWEEAIRNSTDVLVTTGKVLPSYIEGMIETTKEMGPYIVITKHVAIPHARPETGAKELAISIATLAEPVVFGNEENDPVKYIFGLSGLDNKTHLTAMAELAELLDRKEFYTVLDTAACPDEIIDYIQKFEKEEMQK